MSICKRKRRKESKLKKTTKEYPKLQLLQYSLRFPKVFMINLVVSSRLKSLWLEFGKFRCQLKFSCKMKIQK